MKWDDDDWDEDGPDNDFDDCEYEDLEDFGDEPEDIWTEPMPARRDRGGKAVSGMSGQSFPQKQYRHLILKRSGKKARDDAAPSASGEETESEVDADKLLQELDDFCRGNVSDIFVDDPESYTDELFHVLEYVPDLIDEGRYEDANKIITDVFSRTRVWLSDDSYYVCLEEIFDNCLEYWREFTRKCVYPFKVKLMENLRNLAVTPGEFEDDGFKLRELIAEEFKDPECLRRRLEWADEDLAAAEAEGEQGTILEDRVNEKISLMLDLGSPQNETAAVIRKYWNLGNVREQLADSLLERGRKDDAIRVLTECREHDKVNKTHARNDALRCSVAEKTLNLADLYLELGRTEDYKRELAYYLFQMKLPLKSKGTLMDVLKKLKEVCGPDEWAEYRERMLCSERFSALWFDIMDYEGLYERLMDELIKKGSVADVNRYEGVLKPLYPDKLLKFYADYVVRRAPKATTKQGCTDLMRYLQKLVAYPGGEELAEEIAAQWKRDYPRRKDLMEALEDAGF